MLPIKQTQMKYISNLTIDKLLKKGDSAEDALDKSFEKIEISKTDSL